MVLINEVVEKKAPRPPWKVIAAVIVATALVVGAVMYFVLGGEDSDDGKPGAASEGPTTNSLPTGEASIDLSTATSSIAGFPRRFPQTETGAVEAYLGWTLAPGLAIQQPDNVLEEYYADLLPADEAASEAADIFAGREVFGLDENGVFTGPAGTQPYTECQPEYGAYRSEPQSKTRVDVETWMPCVGGVGSPSDTSGLYVYWIQTSMTMTWRDGDWRMALEDGDGIEAPTPENKEKVNVSFTERAEILGDGWEMFEGANQVWPVELLGQEPQ